MLERLTEGLQAAIRKILGTGSLDEKAVKEFVIDIQRTLIQADVNVHQVLDFSKRVESRALREIPPAGLSRKDHIVKILYSELSQLLGDETEFAPPPSRVSTILLVGIQGSGKTTVAGKLGRHFQSRGYRVGLVCADTFRPGALAQLRTLAAPIGVEIYGDEDASDALDVAARGIEYLRAKGKNLIIVDTAGRHKEEKSLLEEMKAMASRISPYITMLAIDGTVGQQCKAQSEAFHEATPVGGIVVTKLDGSAKGGGALAGVAATGAKIMFLSTGERVDDLEAFSPTRYAGRLLGMGDLKALLDRARELELETDEKKVQRIVSGRMTIDDFYYQLEQVKKMGSLKKILELIPGISGSIPTEQLEGIEGKLSVWKSLIQSMTKEEREAPDLINASRIRRIARGSGRHELEAKDMLSKYRQTKLLLKAGRGRALRQFMKKLGGLGPG